MTQQCKVLIVDDNPANIAIMEEIVSAVCDYRCVMSGEKALEVAQDYQPDIVLLDIMMPGMNGYEVCRRLRKAPHLRFVKVIMVSAKALVAERIEAYKAGADDYVTKPFDEDELLAKLQVFRTLKSSEELVELKKELVSLFSDDVRAPLGLIRVSAEALRTEAQLTLEQRRRLASVIVGHAQRLKDSFGRVRLLADLKAHRWSPRPEMVNLQELLRQWVATLRSRAYTKVVQFDFEASLPSRARLDVPSLRHCFDALLDNAIRHSPPDGVITVQAEAQNGSVEIAVTDRGPGISQATKEDVFCETSSFGHEPSDDARSLQLGISLAIVKLIAEAQFGSVSVESEPGCRTTFRVTIPLEPCDESAGPQGEASAGVLLHTGEAP